MDDKRRKILNEIQKAVRDFHRDNPYATEQQAEDAAQCGFADAECQQQFLSNWRKVHDFAESVRRAGFASDVDRIRPERKYG